MSKNDAFAHNLTNAKIIETNRPIVKRLEHNGTQYIETWFFPRFIKRKRDGKVMCWCETKGEDGFVLPSYTWSK